MGIRFGHANVVHRSQGLRLCCWKTALEMLMQYRHNTIYGTVGGVVGGAPRQAHTANVRAADENNQGYQISELAEDYGLRQVTNLSDSIADWERVLGHAPVLLTGKFGMARLGIGRHVILAVGLSHTNKVAYLDPFRTSWKLNDCYIYLERAEVIERVTNNFGVLDAWTTR